jgi:general secretion pathway protein G
VYDNPGQHGLEYDLYTLGADAQEGGEGINADIGNWNVE